MTPPADARLDLGPIKARYRLLADAGIARPIPAGLPHATLIADLANLIAEVERLVAVEGDTVTVDTRQWPTRYDLAPAAVSSSQTWQPAQRTTALELLGHVQANHAMVTDKAGDIHCSCGSIFCFPAPPASEPDK